MKALNLISITRTLLLPALMAAQLLTSAHAGGGVTNASKDGVAIKGYDPVAYFKQDRPVKGSAQHSVEWNGARWRFSSAANRDVFQANPDKYAPQFGGYCAVGTSMGLKIDIQPDKFKVVDDKLYINSSEKAHEMWLKDVPGSIATAQKKWPKIKHQSPEALKAAMAKK